MSEIRKEGALRTMVTRFPSVFRLLAVAILVTVFHGANRLEAAAALVQSASPSTIGLQIFEYSGVISVSPLDGTASNAGTGSQPANTGTVTPISSNTDDLLVAGITIDTPDKIKAVTNGFTLRFSFVSGHA